MDSTQDTFPSGFLSQFSNIRQIPEHQLQKAIQNLNCTKNLKKKLYDPFLWMGFNCLKATEPLRGDNLLFTARSSGVPGTHLIGLGRMKG